MDIIRVTALRCELARKGYLPIPLFGKAPALKHWQELRTVTRAQIEMWERAWPDSRNTGCLTRLMPTLDLDLLNEQAAVAVENLLRERFEESGYVLVRIGQPPKRAIPFRTIQPFPKITVNFLGDKGEKIELLADGQQVVVAGIHPTTKQDYRWFGGEPWSIPYYELPYLHPEQAQTLVTDVTTLLTSEFRYPTRLSSRSLSAHAGNGASDSGTLASNILTGSDYHNSLRDLAWRIVRGLDGGSAVLLLRAMMEASTGPHDQRWQDRYREIPKLVSSALRLIEAEHQVNAD
jgi:hypothetical protein